jgi:hypothetical protein
LGMDLIMRSDLLCAPGPLRSFSGSSRPGPFNLVGCGYALVCDSLDQVETGIAIVKQRTVRELGRSMWSTQSREIMIEGSNNESRCLNLLFSIIRRRSDVCPVLYWFVCLCVCACVCVCLCICVYFIWMGIAFDLFLFISYLFSSVVFDNLQPFPPTTYSISSSPLPMTLITIDSV